MSGWKAIDRPAHWLSKNKKSKRPSGILFFDLESTIHHPSDQREVHTFRLGVGAFCLYSDTRGLLEQEWRDFAYPSDLWSWIHELSAEYDDLLMIAHNIDYDARVAQAFTYLPMMRWEPTYLIPARSCTLYVWKKDKCKLALADNMNWWNTSLADLGESLGKHKLSVDFDTVDDRELYTYCRRDVEILVTLWREWLRFLDKEKLGNFGITVAAQAFNAYRHRFMHEQIGIHNHATAAKLERESYRGGRSECFRIGKLPPGPYYKLDVNSLYPAMMKWYPMPSKLTGVLEAVSVQYLKDLIADQSIIAQVALHTDDPLYVYRMNGRNCYPTGDFIATLTTPELELALIRGDVKGVGLVAKYEPADLFGPYVDFFYALRRKHSAGGNQVQARICKMFLNSLQGKFGQRGYSQKIVGDVPLDEIWIRHAWIPEEGKHAVVYAYGGKIIEQRAGGEPFDSFAAVPAHVAAYGRLYMHSLMQQAGPEHVYYMDTDSLIVDQAGYNHLEALVDPHKLGMLKLEGIAQDVEIKAKKDYKFGELCTRKGIKDNAVALGDDLYEQWHFSTIKYGFRSGNLDTVEVHRIRKQVHYDALAGRIREDGTVVPPRLRLTPKRLEPYLTQGTKNLRRIWSFDPDWLESLQADPLNFQTFDRQPVFDPRTGELTPTYRLAPALA